MKNAIKFLTLGMMLTGTFAITSFAQATAEECTAIYDKYVAKRKGPTVADFDAAIVAGKDYLAKCKDQPQKEVEDYVTKDVPKVEKKRKDLWEKENIIDPFNAAVPAKDWAKAFNLGPQVMNIYPDNVDVPLVLASIGFDLADASPAVDTYNGTTLNMAKLSLQKINEGKSSGSGEWGAFAYIYQTKDCADGKLNATGWMNYTIGYVMYNRQNQKKDALPYLYKSTQAGCETVKNWNIYRMIGAWYVDETANLEKSRQEKLKANADKDNDETLAIYALQKGYTERAIDAYSRAYKVASSSGTPQGTKAKDGYYTRLKSLYSFRFDKEDGLDAYISAQTTKPFPDPSTPVTPIVEAAPTTGTVSSMPTMTTTEAPTASETRPRTAPTTTASKTTTTAATTASSTTTTTTKKAPTKKPAPKKKGTR